MIGFRSIKWRLQLWQMLLLATVLTTLLSLHYHLRHKELIARIDEELQGALVSIMPMLTRDGRLGPDNRPRPPKERLRPPRQEMGDEMDRRPLRHSEPRMRLGDASEHPESPLPNATPKDGVMPSELATAFIESLDEINLYIATFNREGKPASQWGTLPESLQKKPPPPPREKQLFITRDGNRELVLIHHSSQLVVIGRPLDQVNAVLQTTRLYLIGTGAGIMLIGFIGGLLIIQRAIRPITEISQTAERIADGNLNDRIELADAPEELTGMAQTLNQTFNHLDKLINNQKRFTADASHELRTPIAVIMAQTQAALKRDRTTEEYKTILQACLRAGGRMKDLANSLLELTRLENTADWIQRKPDNLHAVVAEAVEASQVLSDKHAITFKSPTDNIPLNMDRERMHQVVTNLLSNAIKHNPEGCDIQVALEPGNTDVCIRISDNGIGIPPEALPHLFDRFYRVDKSRARSQGGSGLGLSIVKSLVEAHDGTISVSAEENKGTQFSITLPLA